MLSFIGKYKNRIKRRGVKGIGLSALVIIFFSGMIIAYNIILYSTSKESMIKNGELNAEQSAGEFDDCLSSGKEAIKLVGHKLDRYIKNNASEKEILDFLTQESDDIMRSTVKNTTGLYAYINGKYYDGAGWDPGPDYVPEERPWYTEPNENKGYLTVVDPYLDAETGDVVITLAVTLGDRESVLALDLNMDEIQSIAEKESADDSGVVKMVLDGSGDVLAHSDKNELGKNYFDESGTLGNMIANTIYKSAGRYFEIDYEGDGYSVYAMPLSEGWYSVSVTRSSDNYRPLMIMLICGAALMLISIGILEVILMTAEKRKQRADRFNNLLSNAANIYMTFYDLDLKNDTYAIVKNVNSNIQEYINKENNNLRAVVSKIMSNLPDSPTKKLAQDFADLNTVDERMKDIPYLSAEYVSVGNIWVRSRFIVGERDEDGTISHLLWMVENIDEEKRKRDKLESANTKLSNQMSATSGIFISVVDFNIIEDTLSVIRAESEVIVKAAGEGDNAQHRFNVLMESYTDVMNKDAIMDFIDFSTIEERIKGHNSIAMEYYSIDGRWRRGRFIPYEYMDDGRLRHVFWTVEDIDAEKKEKADLYATAEQLNMQMRSATDIYIAAYDFDIINDDFTEFKSEISEMSTSLGLCGTNAQQLFTDIMTWYCDSSNMEMIMEFVDFKTLPGRLQGERAISLEFMSREKTWRRARFIPSEYDMKGELTHVLWVLEDIDKEMKEREELIGISEKATAANEAKSAFLSNMSHEIRTPINAILGMNEMVLRESEEENILEYSENIRKAGNNLLGLVNNILDFSKIESGKMEIIPGDYKLSSMLNDLVTMIQARSEAKALKMINDFDPNIPNFLHGDETRIKQIAINILTNAVKYTKEGSVTLKVSFDRIPGDYDAIMMRISVTDTGIGIKQEDIAKLFMKFERIEESRNKNIEGTGLGMSIAQSLLGMMGSTLEVESVYGQGSTFSFCIRQEVVKWEPMGDFHEANKKSFEEREKYTEKFTAPDAHVLVVDDMPMNILVFTSLLNQTDVQIDTANSGDEGIALTLKNNYDMIFLDHMMPNKDGIETLHEIRGNENNPNIHTPTICLTANAITGASEKYIEAGFDDYLTKPIEAAKLEEMMYNYLPNEKVMAASGNKNKNKYSENDAVPDFVFSIPEIDVATGVRWCGNEQIYLEALSTYARVVNTRIFDIKKYWLAGDTKNTVILIHNVKSAARTIGAEWIRNLAQQLETAGGIGDFVTIRLKLPELLDRCKALGERLAPLIKD